LHQKNKSKNNWMIISPTSTPVVAML